MHFKAVQRNLFSPRNGVATLCLVVLVGLTCHTECQGDPVLLQFLSQCVGNWLDLCGLTGHVIATLLEACVVGWKSSVKRLLEDEESYCSTLL